MSNTLENIFVYVANDDVDSFIQNHVEYDVETYAESNKYENKIAFLGSSGKIATKGNIYGGDNEVYIGSVEDAPKDAKIVINTDEDTSVETYSKSELDYLLSVKANNKIIEYPVVTTISISPNKYYIWENVTELTISLTEPENTDLVAEYQFQFSSGDTATTLSLPAGLKWASDKTIYEYISDFRPYKYTDDDGVTHVTFKDRLTGYVCENLGAADGIYGEY